MCFRFKSWVYLDLQAPRIHDNGGATWGGGKGGDASYADARTSDGQRRWGRSAGRGRKSLEGSRVLDAISQGMVTPRAHSVVSSVLPTRVRARLPSCSRGGSDASFGSSLRYFTLSVVTSVVCLSGRYVYEFANQVYSSACITFFMPLLILSMAQQAIYETPIGSCQAVNASCTVMTTAASGGLDDWQCSACTSGPLCVTNGTCSCDVSTGLFDGTCRHCVVGTGRGFWNGTLGKMAAPPEQGLYFFGPVSPFNLTTRVIALSVLLQVLIFVSTGAIGDVGAWRYRFLVITTVLGTGLTMSVIFITDPLQYQAISVLVLVSNALWGTANVFYLAYLPVLVELHEDVIGCVCGLSGVCVCM